MAVVQGTAAGTIQFAAPVEAVGDVIVEGTAVGSIIFTQMQVGTPPTPYARADLLDSTHVANADAY